MPSSPIERLTGTLTADTTPSDLTDSDHRGLLDALAQVPDPRDPRGVRYPLAGLLAIAVCAVLAGAVTFAAIADWLEDLPDDDLQIKAAVEFAVDSDVVVVAATGNAGPDGNPTSYPAAYEDVIAVGGIDQDGRVLPESGHGRDVDLVAPAAAVIAATPQRGHAEWQGTSFAAPFVSAAAALLRQYRPELTARQVARQLVDTADPAPGGPGSYRYGHGVVDPYRAVTERPATASPPVPGERGAHPSVARAAMDEARTPTRTALTVVQIAGMIAIGGVIFGVVRGSGRRRRWRPTRASAPPPDTGGDDPPTGLCDDLDADDRLRR